MEQDIVDGVVCCVCLRLLDEGEQVYPAIIDENNENIVAVPLEGKTLGEPVVCSNCIDKK